MQRDRAGQDPGATPPGPAAAEPEPGARRGTNRPSPEAPPAAPADPAPPASEGSAPEPNATSPATSTRPRADPPLDPGQPSTPRRRAWGVARAALTVALVVAYPAAVYMGLRAGRPRLVALALVAVLLPGLVRKLLSTPRAQVWAALRPLLPTLALGGAAAAWNDPRLLMIVPVVINLSLLVSFGLTLRAGRVPMVERFARMAEPDLPPGGVAHCRAVTRVWVGFFALNAAVTAALAWLDPAWWALHTGVLAYLAMGLLFAGEYLVRKLRFRRYTQNPLDRALAHLFPPPPP